MPLDPAALEPLLRLAVVPRIGPGRIGTLLARFGTAERALNASVSAVATLPGFGAEMARRVREAGSPAGRERARYAQQLMDRVGAVAITPDDAAYPAAFRLLPDAPFLHLFVPRGTVVLEGAGELRAGDAVRFTATGGQRITATEPAEVLVWEMHATVAA